MNNIVKYNSILIKNIIIVSLLILLSIVIFGLYNKYYVNEEFSQITLEKQVRLYDDYRNYLDGKDYLTSRFTKNKRLLPYIVSPKCFSKKYKKCLNNNLQNKHYPQAEWAASMKCQDQSIDSCVTDNFIFL